MMDSLRWNVIDKNESELSCLPESVKIFQYQIFQILKITRDSFKSKINIIYLFQNKK